jgi:hypothetical protein
MLLTALPLLLVFLINEWFHPLPLFKQIDLLETFGTQRVLRQTPANQQHGDQHARHHLPD